MSNSNIESLLDSCYDGIGVLAQMLNNAASAYVDNTTKSSTVIAGLTPVTFLNVLETLTEINKLKEIKVKDLILSIRYQGSNAKLLADKTISINDVVPIKTIAENSKQLASDMNNEEVKLDIVAKSLGVTEEKLKETLSSTVKSVVSPPANLIEDVALNSGVDKKKIDSVLGGVKDISNKVNNDESIPSDTVAAYGVKDDKKKGLPTGAIVGIVIGCVVVVGVAVFLGVFFGVIKKRNQNSEKENSDNGKKNEDL